MKKEQFSRFYEMETRWYDEDMLGHINHGTACLLYTSPSPRDRPLSRMPSSA